MKHQYFADRRDLFKYDLLLDLLESLPGIERLTSILMLTPSDATGEGQVRLAVGRRRPEVAAFLTRCRNENRLHLGELQTFFSSHGVQYHPYSDGEFFDSADRQAYFSDIPQEWLTNALVFFDPDVGLEPRSARHMRRSGPEKYLRYEELAAVAVRVQQPSALVVYQHLQRDKRKIAADILDRAQRFASAIRAPSTGYVTDDDVVFLAGSRHKGVHERLLTALERYGQRHMLAAGHLAG
jgi:hypothetical protein